MSMMQSESVRAKVAGSVLGSPWCHSSHGISMAKEWDTHDLISSTVYKKIIIFVDNFDSIKHNKQVHIKCQH